MKKKYICKKKWPNVLNLKFGKKKFFTSEIDDYEELFYFKVEFNILDFETFIIGVGKTIELAEEDAWKMYKEQKEGNLNSFIKILN